MSGDAVLVAGAGGVLGFEIVRVLRARGARVKAAYRTPRPGFEERLAALGAEPVQWDIDDLARGRALLGDVDRAVFTPILTVSEKAADLIGDKRAVFFSSNNVAIDPYASVYAALADAEERVLARAPGACVLRPTMIYGYRGDGNAARLMGAMRRWPVMAMIGAGEAMQQPVYYGDVAMAAVDLVLRDRGDGERRICVAGPTQCSQRAFYRAVRKAGGAKCVIASVPGVAALAALGLFDLVGVKAPVSAAQISRISMDKTAKGETIIGKTDLEDGLVRLASALDAGDKGA